MGVFDGEVFCITGTFSIPRKQLEALVKANGARTAGSVTKKVTVLLCEDHSTSKAAKATSMGVPIHDEAWVNSQIGGGGKKKATKKTAPKKAAPKKAAPKRKAAASVDEDDDLDPSSMSIGQLKAALKARGEKVSGTKAVLVSRLTAALGGDDEEDDEPPPPKKKAKAVKKAAPKAAPTAAAAAPAKKAKSGNRKVDELCNHSGMAVFEDYDCMLNQTNIAGNNNKYYKIQLLEKGGKYWCWNRWGRVGENGQSTLKGPFDLKNAQKDFCKKFRDKTKNAWDDRASFVPKAGKYTLLEMDDGDEDGEDELDDILEQLAENKSSGPAAKCTLPKQTQDLIKLIFDNDMFKNAMKSMEIDVKKMPLGKLSKTQIKKGNECLQELQDAIESGSRKQMELITSKFYTLVPHSFGRVRPPVIDDDEALQRKFDLLAVLGDIEKAQGLLAGKNKKANKIHPLDANYETLKADVIPLAKTSKEFKVIAEYSKQTMGRKAKLEEVFEISRHGEEKRFSKYKNIKNRKLLWHGTNVAVVVACLSGGLRIMPHSGGRVGKGIYFASEHGKSANYVRCDSKRTGIMFLSEVALGKEHHITRDDWRLTKPPAGYDCIIAQGQQEPDESKETTLEFDGNEVTVPQGKPKSRAKYASSSFYQTEYLVYNEAQNRIRYLLKFKF